MPEYRLKTPALARKVVGLYRKIEQGTVLAYKKIEDRFVDAFLEKKTNPEKPSGHFPGQGGDRS